jgi:hypothetical protein
MSDKTLLDAVDKLESHLSNFGMIEAVRIREDVADIRAALREAEAGEKDDTPADILNHELLHDAVCYTYAIFVLRQAREVFDMNCNQEFNPEDSTCKYCRERRGCATLAAIDKVLEEK